jgi:hypothetical protein
MPTKFVGQFHCFRVGFLGVVLCAIISGCGESDGGMMVKKPASERPDVDRAIAEKGTMILPASQAFNYTSFNSGQIGAARGEAAAVGKDGSRCAAQAGDGGSAWGEFQLGYCFDNTSGTPLDAAVKLKLRLTQTQVVKGSAVDSSGVETNGKSSLRFFIKDSVGQTLKSEDLASSALNKGPQSVTTTHDIVFDARFEPNRGYYLILTGRTDAQAAAEANASIAMDIQQAVFEIAWRPAETKAASADVRAE